MTEDYNKKFHPIVEKAVKMAYADGESILFDDYAVEQLQDLLREYFGTQELVEAVEGLLTLACFLDIEKGSHSASQKIIKVVKSATEALDALANEKKLKKNVDD
jgi:hypothetical protein